MTNAHERAAERLTAGAFAEEWGAPSGIAPAGSSAARREAALHGDAPSRAWASAALEGAPLLVVRLAADGRIDYVNEAFREFVRQSGAREPAADGLGQPGLAFLRGVNEPAGKAFERALRELSRSDGATSMDEYRCDVAGAPRWFRLELRRQGDGVLALHTDLTEQRRAEAHLLVQSAVSTALAARQPLLSAARRIVRITSESLGWDAAAVWVPNDWKQLVCSDVWVSSRLAGSEFENLCRTTTFEHGEGLPGRTWESRRPLWIGDLGAAGAFPRIQRARASGLRSGFAVPLQCEDEVFAVLEFFTTASRPEDPELIELLSIAGFQLGADELRARALVQAEAAAAGAVLVRTQFDAISENAPAYIAVIGRDWRVQFINRAPPHLRRDDIVGSYCLDPVPPPQQPAMRAKIQAVFDTGRPQRHELILIGPDGRELWLTTQMGPLRERGEVTGVVTISIDTTELKRTQLEFAAAQRWVSVGTLAAGIAHEINTPIQFVNDNITFIGKAARRLLGLARQLAPLADRIARDAPDGELSDAAATAAQAAKSARLAFLEAELPHAIDACVGGLGRVSTIVRSLEEFARPPAEDMEFVDLNHVVDLALAIAINEHRAVADVATHFGELPPVRCHAAEIGQVILNLVMNATHAIADAVRGTERRGTLEICTWREGDEAIISIRDTGTGIPEAIRPRIFDPFFTTKAVGQGTGQGLALAWSVIKQKHGGTLTFESTVGEGSVFFIRLPIAGASASREAIDGPASGEISRGEAQRGEAQRGEAQRGG